MGNKKKQTNEFDNYFDDDFEVVYEDLEDLGSYLSEDSSDNNNDYDDYDGYDGDTDYYDDDDDDYDNDYDDDDYNSNGSSHRTGGKYTPCPARAHFFRTGRNEYSGGPISGTESAHGIRLYNPCCAAQHTADKPPALYGAGGSKTCQRLYDRKH